MVMQLAQHLQGHANFLELMIYTFMIFVMMVSLDYLKQA